MKISVVTPSFNQGQFIERTVQSVLSQNCGPHELEYVVMDGGSSDQTVSILASYATKLFFISEPDRGQTHAINKGINATSGEIIGWLNSDDIYYPDALKKVCDFFTAHPQVEMVYADAKLIDVNDNFLAHYPTEKWHVERLKSRCFISQPATFIRREAVLKYGHLNEQLHFCMDYEYWLRLGLNGARIVYLPESLAGARIYADTKSSRLAVEASLEAMSMLQEKLGDIPPEWTVNHSIANVKVYYGLNALTFRYIPAVSLDLWATSGLHHQGLARLIFWMSAQKRLAKKSIARVFNALGKRLVHTV